MTIGHKIKQYRRSVKMTQEELASQLNITPQAISKWENGDTLPDILMLSPLAKLFNTSIDDLLCHCSSAPATGYTSSQERLLSKYEHEPSDDAYDKAVQAYERILLHEKPTIKDYWHYAYLHELRAKQDIQTSIQYYTKAIEQSSGSSKEVGQAFAQLIALFDYLGKPEKALSLLDQWLQKMPHAVDPYVQLANNHLKCNHLSEALEWIVKGKAIEPLNSELFLIEGDAYERLGEYAKAIASWDKAYDLNNGVANALFSKATLLEKMNETEKAIKAWETCIDWLIRQGFDRNGELEYPQARLIALQN